MSKRAAQTRAKKKSTNVRSRELQLARGAMGVLSAVAPPLATRLALRLFTATRRTRPREGERDILGSATRFVVPWKQERLVAWSWGRGPTVLLVHGWNGRATQLAPFVQPLRDAGYRVVAFDNIGHGQSTGARATIVDFADTIAAVARAAGGAHAIIAHSMGGASSTIAFHDGLEVDRAIFIAAPTEPSKWIERFSEMLQLGANTQERFLRALEERVGRAPDALDGVTIAAEQSIPLLAIHDEGDREIPASASRELTAAWPGARLIITEGLGHQRILSDPGVIQNAVQFLCEGERLAA